ncbi:hypothetical protein Droror1_Dr00026312 [Drosera rotundifolia]
MPKEFTVPPVIFPSGATASTTTTTTQPTLNQRRVAPTATAPFQPPFRPPSMIPFLSFDISSTATSSHPPPPPLSTSSSSYGGPLFIDEPPLLDELEINPTLIWHKMKAILNPIRLDSSIHGDPDLSGPFLFYIVLCLFQLLAGKVQFGVNLGWIAMASIFVYTVTNFLAGRNGNLDLYRCVSVVGYCMMPIVVFAAVSLFFEAKGTVAGFVVAGACVAWATRVCSILLVENGGGESVVLVAYPCFLVYSLFSLLVMF